jgi:hypothetical protein
MATLTLGFDTMVGAVLLSASYVVREWAMVSEAVVRDDAMTWRPTATLSTGQTFARRRPDGPSGSN